METHTFPKETENKMLLVLFFTWMADRKKNGAKQNDSIRAKCGNIVDI